MRVGIKHSEWERRIGDTVNTADSNWYEVEGSVELAFEAAGISLLEVCGAGEYWFGEYDYGDNPAKSVSTGVPIVSLCTEIDTSGGRDDG